MKLVCSFQFDGASYHLSAHMQVFGRIDSLSALPNKGPLDDDVRERVDLLGKLLAYGLPFEAVLETQGTEPLTCAILAGIERALETAAGSLKSSGFDVP